jgi:hypothetical protein
MWFTTEQTSFPQIGDLYPLIVRLKEADREVKKKGLEKYYKNTLIIRYDIPYYVRESR